MLFFALWWCKRTRTGNIQRGLARLNCICVQYGAVMSSASTRWELTSSQVRDKRLIIEFKHWDHLEWWSWSYAFWNSELSRNTLQTWISTICLEGDAAPPQSATWSQIRCVSSRWLLLERLQSNSVARSPRWNVTDNRRQCASRMTWDSIASGKCKSYLLRGAEAGRVNNIGINKITTKSRLHPDTISSIKFFFKNPTFLESPYETQFKQNDHLWS